MSGDGSVEGVWFTSTTVGYRYAHGQMVQHAPRAKPLPLVLSRVQVFGYNRKHFLSDPHETATHASC
jgi:hypothetical protein